MTGMDRETGKALSGIEHLRQSIRDILTTPIGSRVMRRDYGSRLFELLDSPLNDGVLGEIYAATAEALERWEPRLRVTKVRATRAGEGGLTIDLAGEYLPEGGEIALEGIVV